MATAAFGNRPRSASVQIKVCGLTDAGQAVRCVELGVDAIGFVFYPPSPRYLADDRVAEISREVSDRVCKIGVFVDESYDTIMRKAELCGLRGVQLHGRETPALVERLQKQRLTVIKALFVNRSPEFSTAASYTADAYLAECAGGRLPGGNALAWDWSTARALGDAYPLILAGGLAPENVGAAIAAALPDAVDVSSGVEASPGLKSLDKVRAFLAAVKSVSQPTDRSFPDVGPGTDRVVRVF
jgi:phosphoribosylanthranilate isomerase